MEDMKTKRCEARENSQEERERQERAENDKEEERKNRDWKGEELVDHRSSFT